MHYSLTHPYVVQDDARQHVVWLQRFFDPQLFPNDLIANYYHSIAPSAYKFLYWTVAKIGIEPVVLAKALPTLLGLITTVYIFKFSLKILPIPASAFLTSLILNQNFWLKDDVSSATPRAFLYPIFAAFLYYLTERSLIPCLITIILQGLFFPALVFVQVALLIVRLFHWQNYTLRLSRNREDYYFCIGGFIVAVAVIIPFAMNVSEFGSMITAAQAKAMPEFWLNGRREYYGVHPLRFLFAGASGLRAPLLPPTIWFSITLPFLLKVRAPQTEFITSNIKILGQLIIASLGMFVLAHLVFPRLYLPNRYTYHSFRFIMAIATGITLFILLDAAWKWIKQKRNQFSLKQGIFISIISFGAVLHLTVPALPIVFLNRAGWQEGEFPKIYEFLAQQPKEILTASLAKEVSNLPAFSMRSILVGREFALVYHPQYYAHIEERARDLIDAQYSTDLSVAKQIIQKYGIDFLMIDQAAFDPNYLLAEEQNWLTHSSFQVPVFNAIDRLQKGETPAIAKLIDDCEVVSEKNLVLLESTCIALSLAGDGD